MPANSRTKGLVPDELTGRTAFVGGLGAGSESALKLARLGVNLVIADFDIVEAANLSRTAYFTDDVGLPKATALKRLVARAAPDVSVRAFAEPVQAVLAEDWAANVGQLDLIVAGTDSLEAQAYLNNFAMKNSIPAVFIDVHERSRGGMVTLVLPGETPCYRCVAHQRFLAQAAGNEPVDLHGALGLSVDVGIIDSVALKIALAVLGRGTTTDAGRFFEAVCGRSQVVVRCHPDYRFGGTDIFDLVLSDLPTAPRDFKADLQSNVLLACDTLWLKPDFEPGCPDCAARAGAQ
ncbi:MAG: ThiF family adenylyltransferase [Myxococcota bacterium]